MSKSKYEKQIRNWVSSFTTDAFIGMPSAQSLSVKECLTFSKHVMQLVDQVMVWNKTQDDRHYTTTYHADKDGLTPISRVNIRIVKALEGKTHIEITIFQCTIEMINGSPSVCVAYIVGSTGKGRTKYLRFSLAGHIFHAGDALTTAVVRLDQWLNE